MTCAVELRGVRRTFGSGHVRVEALQSVTMSIAPGEMVAVMGPSGSGKSTLLALIGGLDRPSAGHLFVLGEDVMAMGADRLARLRRQVVGYVFQELNLIPTLTAAENIALPLDLDGRPSRETRAIADELLAKLLLSEVAERFPDDLSGGEQQRVAIARAMAGDRPVVLADEPTGALDSINGEIVMRLLRTHCDLGGAVIVATHNAAHAAWADRVVFLRDGRVIDEARPAASSEVDAPSRWSSATP